MKRRNQLLSQAVMHTNQRAALFSFKKQVIVQGKDHFLIIYSKLVPVKQYHKMLSYLIAVFHMSVMVEEIRIFMYYSKSCIGNNKYIYLLNK